MPRPLHVAQRSGLGFDVRVGRNAGAHQVPVAVGALDPSHRRPELALADPAHGEGGALTRVAAIPSIRDDRLEGVWRVLQRVVLAIQRARLDLAHLVAYRDERLAE